ncbi:hypothetical protein H0H92_004708, partial [Tricholoma furcatifolium]
MAPRRQHHERDTPPEQQTLDPTPASSESHHNRQSEVAAAVDSVIVSARANSARSLIDKAVESSMPSDEFAESLRELGLSANEAVEYVEEFQQRIRIRHEKSKEFEAGPRDETPPVGTDEERISAEDRAADEAAWAVLKAKLAADQLELHTSRGGPRKIIEGEGLDTT